MNVLVPLFERGTAADRAALVSTLEDHLRCASATWRVADDYAWRLDPRAYVAEAAALAGTKALSQGSSARELLRDFVSEFIDPDEVEP